MLYQMIADINCPAVDLFADNLLDGGGRNAEQGLVRPEINR